MRTRGERMDANTQIIINGLTDDPVVRAEALNLAYTNMPGTVADTVPAAQRRLAASEIFYFGQPNTVVTSET